jgi:hypothetical protein
MGGGQPGNSQYSSAPCKFKGHSHKCEKILRDPQYHVSKGIVSQV